MSPVPNLPGVTTTIRDGALGAAAASGDEAVAVIGVCTGGTPNTVYGYADVGALFAALASGPTGGPAVEAAAYQLQHGRRTVYVVPVTQSVDGSVGSVTLAGTGLDPGATFTGTPKDAYAIQVKITKGGARGTARFKIAFDADNPDGPTWSNEIVTAATYALGPLVGTGLTIAFATGTYVLDDVYSATCVAPGYSNTNLQTAFAALIANPALWRFVHVIGEAASLSASATTAGVLDTLLAGAETAKRYCWGLMQAPTGTDADTLAAFSDFVSKRVAVAAGFCSVTSVLTGRTVSRGAAWAAAAWATKLGLSTDLGAVAEGPLPGVTAIARDEAATPGLDAGRFLTLRTHLGLAGFWVNNPRIMALAGSDFELIQMRQVLDVACTVGRASLLQFLNKAVLVNANGTIEEGEAITIESTVRADIAAELLAPGHASAVTVTVDRTTNVVTTKKITAKIRVTPKGYLKTIDADIGFENPRLAAA